MYAIRTKLLAYRLDYHWYRLKKIRKSMLALYEQGVSFSAPQMLSLNNRYGYHCAKASALDRLFLAATSPHG